MPIICSRAETQVRILDNSIKKLDQDQIKECIESFQPNLVGFTTYAFSIKSCFSSARLIKQIIPQAKIVFGGPHATYLPYETLSNECVDIVVRGGEGEETMTELVNTLARGQPFKGVKGILYKDKSTAVIDNGPRRLIEDLDFMPLPAYEFLRF